MVLRDESTEVLGGTGYWIGVSTDLCRLFSILDLAHDAREAVNRALEPYGLTEATFGVMYALQSGVRTNKCLADGAGCAPSNITRLLDRLVEQGLVERTRSEEDRRKIVARLTDEGRSRWQAAAAALGDTQETLLRRVGEVVESVN